MFRQKSESSAFNLTSDTCIIDGRDFFVRALIEIPIHDHPEKLGFGVWVSLKQENFYTYLQNSNSDQIGPFFGWLCTQLDYYSQNTLLLKTMVYFQGNYQRPIVKVEPTGHPLAIDQNKGISWQKAENIVHYYLDSGNT